MIFSWRQAKCIVTASTHKKQPPLTILMGQEYPLRCWMTCRSILVDLSRACFVQNIAGNNIPQNHIYFHRQEISIIFIWFNIGSHYTQRSGSSSSNGCPACSSPQPLTGPSLTRSTITGRWQGWTWNKKLSWASTDFHVRLDLPPSRPPPRPARTSPRATAAPWPPPP